LFEDDEYLINVPKDVIIHIHNFGVPIKTNAVMWITSDSGVCIYAYIKIISAILGELTQVTISTYPGKGKQTTGNVLLVASTPYYIYVKEEFKAEIIAKIDEIRGVPHLPSSNKHALLSKNITMITPQFVQCPRLRRHD
jgi:hypothetical protein